jgi:hypothetical protein
VTFTSIELASGVPKRADWESFDVVTRGGRPGKTVVNARVDRGALELAAGHLPDADLVIEAERPLNPLLSGEVSPGEAVESGTVRVTGTPELLERFVEIFHTPSAAVALPPA